MSTIDMTSTANPREAAKRLALPAVEAGLPGGLLMIVMGAQGMGYASPLNLGR